MVECLSSIHKILGWILGATYRPVWWHVSIIPVWGTWTPEDEKFKIIFSYAVCVPMHVSYMNSYGNPSSSMGRREMEI